MVKKKKLNYYINSTTTPLILLGNDYKYPAAPIRCSRYRHNICDPTKYLVTIPITNKTSKTVARAIFEDLILSGGFSAGLNGLKPSGPDVTGDPQLYDLIGYHKSFF